MKYLIVIGVLAVVFYALLYWRLRPYFATIRRILGIVRDVRRMSQPSEHARRATTTAAASEVGGRLIRCDACGIWTPAARAVKLRGSASSYCSHNCLENAVADSSRKRAGGKR